MLVLTRKLNESIVVGENIVITIVEIRGEQVRIGIEAPADVAVYRSEIYEEIVRQNSLAAVLPGSASQLPRLITRHKRESEEEELEKKNGR